jgi:hypothetical protein
LWAERRNYNKPAEIGNERSKTFYILSLFINSFNSKNLLFGRLAGDTHNGLHIMTDLGLRVLSVLFALSTKLTLTGQISTDQQPDPKSRMLRLISVKRKSRIPCQIGLALALRRWKNLHLGFASLALAWPLSVQRSSVVWGWWLLGANLWHYASLILNGFSSTVYIQIYYSY